MPDLKCSVTKCNYNCQGLCCLDGIDVCGGEKKEKTCCSSFTDAPSSVNSIGRNLSAKRKTDICCSASDCEFNNCKKCTAESVDICRCPTCRCEPCVCTDTECSTFKKK